MKNAILTIVSLAVLGCQAQYKTMLHARITPTNSVVVDIPDWAKSDTPPVSEDGTLDYNALTNKPSINGTTIEGSLTTEDLGITVGASDYNDLTNKPSINGVTLAGNCDPRDLGLALGDGGDAIFAFTAMKANELVGSSTTMTADNISSELEAKRDKTDNIVAVDSFKFSDWKFACDIPEIQAAMDAATISVTRDGVNWEGKPVWLISGLPESVDRWQLDTTSSDPTDNETPERIVWSNPYIGNDPETGDYEWATVTATREKIVIAKEGETFVSPTGVELLTKQKRDLSDNIVAADSFLGFSPWRFHCDVKEIEDALNANPPEIRYSGPFDDGYCFYCEFPNIGEYMLYEPLSDSFPASSDEEAKNATEVYWQLAYATTDEYGYAEDFIPLYVTRSKIIAAKTGESYVSPVYVTNTIKEATADHVKSNDMASAIAPINNNVNVIWSYVYGESVWIAVTNYMRTIGGVAPSFQLWEKRDGQTNLVYWSAEEIDIRVGDKITVAMSNIVDTVVTAKADRAWSKYQSMTGADNPQPNDVTIVSTPSVMLSGGYEWQRFVDTGAEVWVLKCNDLITLGADTNAYFRITDLEGETQFAIEKTASKLVDAVPTATGFTTDGNNYFKVTFSGNIQPTIYVSPELVSSFFLECNATENEHGLSCTWEHDTAANTYTATIAHNAGDGKPSRMFVYGKVLQEGSTVVKHTAPSSFDGGIIINGIQYSVGTATIDGKTVMTLNPVTRAVSE